MDVAGVMKMILVDFVEYNQMKIRLQAFLDKKIVEQVLKRNLRIKF